MLCADIPSNNRIESGDDCFVFQGCRVRFSTIWHDVVRFLSLISYRKMQI